MKGQYTKVDDKLGDLKIYILRRIDLLQIFVNNYQFSQVNKYIKKCLDLDRLTFDIHIYIDIFLLKISSTYKPIPVFQKIFRLNQILNSDFNENLTKIYAIFFGTDLWLSNA